METVATQEVRKSIKTVRLWYSLGIHSLNRQYYVCEF